MFTRCVLFVPLCLVASVLVIGCKQSSMPSAAQHDADVKSLRDADAAWSEAWFAKDLDKAMAFYADDATELNPDSPAVIGKQNIVANDKMFFTDPHVTMRWVATTVEVSQSGDMGYTQGNVTYMMVRPAADETSSDTAKYLTVWKKQADGSWRVVEDTYNSDHPTPPAGK
jgi:uncharacterized protein (TIGR02246 family)